MTQIVEQESPSPYEITRPVPEDMPRLLELWQEQYDFHHNLDPIYYAPFSREDAEAHLQEIMQQDQPPVFVAREGGNILGFITFGTAEDNYLDANMKKLGEMKELLVTEEARGRGVAQELIKAVENYFQTQGVQHIRVQCSSFNKPALALYEKQGYETRQALLYKTLRNVEGEVI